MDRTREWLAPAFLLHGSPRPFSPRAYPNIPTGNLAGNHSNSKEGSYHDQREQNAI
jgi:hypothetical protein